MKKFTLKVVENIRKIPVGNVATYGQIAHLSGNKRAARQVARILHSMSHKYKLPWYRVLNAKGKIVVKHKEEQKQLLENEGVYVDSHFFVNLSTYQWIVEDDYSDWMQG